MDTSQQLERLIDLAGQLAVDVRRGPLQTAAGDSPVGSGGAVVRLRGRQIVFLDSLSPLADQIAVLASALAGKQELNDRFLRPEIRELIDAARPRQI